MIRSEIRTLVIGNIGRTTDDTLINLALNLGLREAGMRHVFRESRLQSDVVTVAATATVSLPATFYHLMDMRLIDGTSSYPVIIKTRKWLTDRYANVTSDTNSKPVYAFVESGLINLFPVPDAVYTLRLNGYKITTFASDSTECPITGLENFLVAWVTGYCFDSKEQFDKGISWRQRAEEALQRLILADDRSYEKLQAVGQGRSSTEQLDSLSRDNVTDIISGNIYW